ncbi:MAG TPA: hypothetical protein PLA90_17810, partial [Candidatus Sumerlaeota bacterium]|nr:hypothetical protein [Candidatus Sumerlaeota bacterium]
LRILVEIAVSECPLEGGYSTGRLDFSSLMADVQRIFDFGGFSDAIHKEVMDPTIEITPRGDICVDTQFLAEVAEPLGRKHESERLDYMESRYETLFEPEKPVISVHEVFSEFSPAFEEEFGLSIDDLRGTRDALQDLAIEKERSVFIARRDEILQFCSNREFSSEKAASTVLDRFSLWPREKWNSVPKGYVNGDLHPWRFGRKLSLYAKPLVRIEESDNPRFIISPGLMSVGVQYLIQRYYYAEIDESDCQSSKMQSWIAQKKNAQGNSFEQRVFDVVKSLGYEASKGMKVTALLGKKFDKDYGDIDVLTWKSNGKDVFSIECKDLRIAKTANEVGEQLNRFRGCTFRNGKRDNLLKHLDRCDLLREKRERVAQTLGLNDANPLIHTIVCFSNPVPMQYVAKRFPHVSFRTLDEIIESGKIVE